jgi:hypothetical protein
MSDPVWNPRERVKDPAVIHTHSIVSHRTGRGIVVIEWGEMGGQFDPEDARVFAHTILRECDNAETDAFIYGFMKDNLEASPQALGAVITELRTERAKREQLAGLRKKGIDEIPEDDRR